MNKFSLKKNAESAVDGKETVEDEIKKIELHRPLLMFYPSPFKIFMILILIIFLLLLLIFFFGLGRGGGKSLPGSGTSLGSTKVPATAEKSPDTKELAKQIAQASQRRELRISFIPSATNPGEAKPLECNVHWTDAVSGSQETRLIVETNKPDFEFSLEKVIRAWYNAAPPKATTDIPIVAVGMTPFPGEGVLRKIGEIVHDVDIRISFLRMEKESPGLSN